MFHFASLLALALPCVYLSGCATAGDDGGTDQRPDAAPRPDAPNLPMVDAMPPPPPPPDARPVPDAAPQCTDQDVQLLANPGFELGNSNWVEVAADPIIFDSGTLPVQPQAGNRAAWLGGVNSATRTLYQDVSLPADARNLRFSFYRYIATEESGGVWDTLNVSLRNASNTVLEPVVDWDNTYSNNAWQQYNHTVAGAFAGQTIRVYLSSTNDGSLNTNFFIDTMAMTATVCL